MTTRSLRNSLSKKRLDDHANGATANDIGNQYCDVPLSKLGLTLALMHVPIAWPAAARLHCRPQMSLRFDDIVMVRYSTGILARFPMVDTALSAVPEWRPHAFKLGENAM